MRYRGNGQDDDGLRGALGAMRSPLAEPTGICHTNVNIVCELCDMTMPDPAFRQRLATDYFNVVMRVGRPLGRVARFRRAR